ncbi:uncharacterized protein FRV6_10641 [Fusarium oxysporum]|uniref:Uncharacterized protein n=2 Tax=Fusarium oxysporum TaxID=5507 RepID=A0A2H3TCR8_FUSOX|nr:hypothetical protein FOTG_01292 [Fusarium oxysporum f. sp. vasinfectum 25433]SCO86514.1 uncharacterized protein FRV6_10641 [Fusarium oxysporum]
MVLALTEQQRKKIIAMDIFGHQQFVSGLKVWNAHALAAYNVVGLVVVGH